MKADALKKLREVAETLNTSLSNVYSLVSQGRLPVVRTGANGKGYRVAQADLDRFIEEGKKGRRIAPPPEKLRPFKRLNGDRLRDSWKRQGIRVDPQDGDSARSS
jgi:excisionase family DNA binding protein